MKKVLALIAVALLVMALAAGCGKSTKTIKTDDGTATVTTERGPGRTATVEVETEDGKMVATAKEEKKTITEAELGLPVYPGTTVEGTMETSSGEHKSTHYVLASDDSFEDVTAFYKKNLKNVKNTMNIGSGDDKAAVFTMGSDTSPTTVSIAWDSDEDKTMISVTKISQ